MKPWLGRHTHAIIIIYIAAMVTVTVALQLLEWSGALP